jgi:hypothetical protein
MEEHTPTNEPIEGVVSIEGCTRSAGTGFKESLLLSVNPEAEFVDPAEDLDSVLARRGGAFEEAQTWRPVIVRIHPDAGRETVLRLLDKVREGGARSGGYRARPRPAGIGHGNGP